MTANAPQSHSQNDHRCKCGARLKGLSSRDSGWRTCGICGRESRLVGKSIADAKSGDDSATMGGCGWVIAVIILLQALFRDLDVAERIPLFIVGVLIAVGSSYLLSKKSAKPDSGKLKCRETAVSQKITGIEQRLLELEPGHSEPPEKALKYCQRALAKLEEIEKLPRNGHRLVARASVASAIAANQLGRTRDAMGYVSRMRQLPKNAQPFYWTTRCLCAIRPASQSTVDICLRALKSSSQTLKDIRPEVLDALQHICTVQADMSKSELQIRIKWNQKARKDLGSEPWAVRNEAQGWHYLKRYSRAASLLQEHPLEKEFWESQLLLAQAEFHDGMRESADARVATLTGWVDQDPEIGPATAAACLRMGQEEKAQLLLQQCEQAGASVAAQACLVRARHQLGLRDAKQARSAARAALEHDPENPDALLLLAEILSACGRNSEAVQLLELASQKHVENADIFAALGRALWNESEFSRAVTPLRSAIRHGAAPAAMIVLIARCLLEVGDFDGAADALGQAVGLPEKDALVAAFSRGLALLQKARQGNGREAAQALPYFQKAVRLGKQAGNKDAATRARINMVNCYRLISEDTFAVGSFRQAAAAWLQTSKSFQSGHANHDLCRDNAAEAFLRAGLQTLQHHSPENALDALKSAATLRETAKVLEVLAAVQFETEHYAEAAVTYERLLQHVTSKAKTRFLQALSKARAGDESGIQTMETLLGRPGPLRLQIALGAADIRAAAGEFNSAAESLVTAVREDRNTQDPCYAECCCKAVLYTVKDGRTGDAKNLVDEFFGNQSGMDSRIVLGSVLAEVQEYEEAFSALRDSVDAQSSGSELRSLLYGVAARVAVIQCQAGDFESARRSLAIGAWDGSDREFKLFSELLNVACNSNDESGGVNEQTVRMLEECGERSADLQALVARPVLIGNCLSMVSHAGAENFEVAESHSEQLRECWKTSFGASASIWESYVSEFNEGKDYQFDSGRESLRTHVRQRLIGLWLGNLKLSLLGCSASRDANRAGVPKYDAVRFYWQSLKSMVGATEAEERVREALSLTDIAGQVGREVSDDEAIRLAQFIGKEMFADDELSELAIVRAIDGLLYALAECNERKFRTKLDAAISASEGNSEYKGFWDNCTQIRNMSGSIQDEIIGQIRRDSDLSQVQSVNPSAHRMACFQIMAGFSGDYSFQNSVSTYFDRIKWVVLNDLMSGD